MERIHESRSTCRINRASFRFSIRRVVSDCTELPVSLHSFTHDGASEPRIRKRHDKNALLISSD